MGGATYQRGLHVAGSGLATLACALPMLRELRVAYPELVAHLNVLEPAEVSAALLRGDVDIAVLSKVLNHPELQNTRIGEATNGVYCAPSHELAQAEEVDWARLANHPFTAPPADEVGNTDEGWPPERPRRVVLRSPQMHLGAQACATAGLLAVLPDFIGQLHGLTRLPIDGLPTIPIIASHRRPLESGRDFSILLRALSRALEDAEGVVPTS